MNEWMGEECVNEESQRLKSVGFFYVGAVCSERGVTTFLIFQTQRGNSLPKFIFYYVIY